MTIHKRITVAHDTAISNRQVLFVTNIPLDMPKPDVSRVLSNRGFDNLIIYWAAHLPFNRRFHPGWAHVEFATAEEAEIALAELPKLPLHGSTLKVEYAEEWEVRRERMAQDSINGGRRTPTACPSVSSIASAPQVPKDTVVPAQAVPAQAVPAQAVQPPAMPPKSESLYDQATLLTRFIDSIKDQDPATVRMALAMFMPAVMDWMQMMHQYNPEMAEVVLETWAKDHPRKPNPTRPVDSVPGMLDLLALMEGTYVAAGEDESCHLSEAGSI